MKKYRSHKVVEAAKIVRVGDEERAVAPSGERALVLEGGSSVWVTGDWRNKHSDNGAVPLVGGYFVRYADGYESWSPAEAFEEGYSDLENEEQKDEVKRHPPGNPKVAKMHEEWRKQIDRTMHFLEEFLSGNWDEYLQARRRLQECLFWGTSLIARTQREMPDEEKT